MCLHTGLYYLVLCSKKYKLLVLMINNYSCDIISGQRPSLVDLPVRVNIWIRPYCQRAQFEVLKKACPSVLFLQSDGGRNEDEWKAIRRNRKIFDKEIDWNCTVYKVYEESNNGLYAMSNKVCSIIWSVVDRCLFLEDDYVPSVSCFTFHAELLEKYKDDLRVYCICSLNQLEAYNRCSSDYFFSRQGSIWGCSFWRNRVENRFEAFKKADDPYILHLLKQRTQHNKTAWRRLNAYLVNDMYEGHVAGTEFYIEFSMYAYNMLQIIPRLNLLTYIGDTPDASHASERNLMPKAIRRIFGMKAYELDFPLKHPSFVIPDVAFEKKRNRIMGHNTPFVDFARRVEKIIYYICAGKVRLAFKKAFVCAKGNNKER